MRECFVKKRFSQESLNQIALVNKILDEYESNGYRLTLRQLYYQLVSRGHIENSIHSYQRIGNIVSDARLAGMIDWDLMQWSRDNSMNW